MVCKRGKRQGVLGREWSAWRRSVHQSPLHRRMRGRVCWVSLPCAQVHYVGVRCGDGDQPFVIRDYEILWVRVPFMHPCGVAGAHRSHFDPPSETLVGVALPFLC
jgi:hypothetical protein